MWMSHFSHLSSTCWAAVEVAGYFSSSSGVSFASSLFTVCSVFSGLELPASELLALASSEAGTMMSLTPYSDVIKNLVRLGAPVSSSIGDFGVAIGRY
jgi:hypothetical protein